MKKSKKRRAELKRKHEAQKALREQKAAKMRKVAERVNEMLVSMKWRTDLIQQRLVYSRSVDLSFVCKSHGSVSVSIKSKAFHKVRHSIMADEIKSIDREYIADILDSILVPALYAEVNPIIEFETTVMNMSAVINGILSDVQTSGFPIRMNDNDVRFGALVMTPNDIDRDKLYAHAKQIAAVMQYGGAVRFDYRTQEPQLVF